MVAFRWFFAARSISLLGSMIAPLALTFAVLQTGGTMTDVGLLQSVRLVPYLALVLIGGATADRFSRSTVLKASHLGSGAIQATAAALLLTGNFNLGVFIGLQALSGAMGAFTSPAARGVVPQLVPPERLQKATSLLGSARKGAMLLGPIAGASIAATIGGGWAIALDALTFFVAAACYARIPLEGRAARSTLKADLKEGWVFLKSTKWVWAVVVSFCVTNAVYVGVLSVLGPVIASGTIGQIAWGWVVSTSGAGLLVMTAFLYRVRTVPLWLGQLTTVLAAIPVFAIGHNAGTAVLAAAAFVEGLGMGMFAIAWETTLQRKVPNEMLSRVAAYDELGQYVAIPLGAVTAPFAAAHLGYATTSTVGAAIYVIAALAPLPLLLAERHPPRQPERQRS